MAVGSSATLTVQTIVAKEKSPINIPSYQIDAANLATWLTGWAALKTATDAIITGVLEKETVRIYETALSSAMPTSQYARRELKMQVTFTGDISGKSFRIEVPTPDLAALTLESGDANYVVLDDSAGTGVMAAWVSAFEAIARSPENDAENVTVQSAKIVGRNL